MEGSTSEILNSNKKAKCEICAKELANSKAVKHHFTLIHKKQNYQCVSCKKVYSYESSLKKHICRQIENKCQTCGKTNKDNKALLQHIATKHDEVTSKKCDICGKGFGTQLLLRRHVKRVHINTFKFKCKICDESFSYKSVLKNHTNLHNATTKFKCEICSKEFLWQTSYKNHAANIHNKVRNHKCETCGKSFFRSNI